MWELVLGPAAQGVAEHLCQRFPSLLKHLAGLWRIPTWGHQSLDDFATYDYRLRQNADAKAKIAFHTIANVLSQIPGGLRSSILLDSGSVTYNVAFQLFAYHLGNVVTNNYAVATLYHEMEHLVPNRCRLLPGEMLRDVCAQGGPEAAAAAKEELTRGTTGQPRTDTAILGLRAYTREDGLTEDTPQLSAFQAEIVRHAKHLIVVAQGEKFLKRANAPILHSSEFREVLEQRKADKSIWFVHHAPTCNLEPAQRAYYERNLEDFASLLPAGHVFDASATKINRKLILTQERFRAA